MHDTIAASQQEPGDIILMTTLRAAALTARLMLGVPTPMPPTREEAKHAFTGPQVVVINESEKPMDINFDTATRIILLPAPPREPSNPDFVQQIA